MSSGSASPLLLDFVLCSKTAEFLERCLVIVLLNSKILAATMIL